MQSSAYCTALCLVDIIISNSRNSLNLLYCMMFLCCLILCFCLLLSYTYTIILYRPVYSGHFHKPHTVKPSPRVAPGVNIQYVGSPYETSLAEAGQEKALLVLDSTQHWNITQTIPLKAGRRHFRYTSVTDFVSAPPLATSIGSSSQDITDTGNCHDGSLSSIIGPAKGDRVVVSVPHQELIDMRLSLEPGITKSLFDLKVEKLLQAGVKVEVREVKTMPPEFSKMDNPPSAESNNDTAGEKASSNNETETDSLGGLLAEDMLPADTLAAYIMAQVERQALTNETAIQLLNAATDLLHNVMVTTPSSSVNNNNGGNHKDGEGQGEIDRSNSNPFSFSSPLKQSSSSHQSMSDIEFTSVSLKGYGCFQKKVVYPLNERGVVLIRGSNRDGGYARYVRAYIKCCLRSVRNSIILIRAEVMNGVCSVPLYLYLAQQTLPLFVFSDLFLLFNFAAMGVESQPWSCPSFGHLLGPQTFDQCRTVKWVMSFMAVPR
jgi:hypothetical protein